MAAVGEASSIAGVMAERGTETAAAAVEAWRRCLERRRAGAAPDGGLDEAVAALLPRGGAAAVGPRSFRLVVGAEAVGAVEELPDEVVVGWAYAAAAGESAPSGYDRLIVDLLEGGFRPVAERAGLPAPVEGQAGAPPFRVVRARRDGYRMRGYRPGDEDAIFDLFRETFGARQDPRQWAWRFVDNPRGGPRISLAFSPGGELVGQYCAYPVRWHGLPPPGPAESHQVGDTMTHPGVRAVGRGPTSLLARTGRHFYLTHCKSRVAFNYGFNTGNITKFSCRFLEAAVVEEVPYRELPASAPLGRGARLARRYDVRRIAGRSEVDAEFDALFERASGRYGLLVERSAEYVRWRYVDCPVARPELVCAWRRGRLVAWVAARRLADRVEWGDALVEPAELSALNVLLEEIRAPGLPIVGWFSDRPRWLSRKLDSLGFVRRPEPQALVTIQVPFACRDARSLLLRSYYTKGDSDLF